MNFDQIGSIISAVAGAMDQNDNDNYSSRHAQRPASIASRSNAAQGMDLFMPMIQNFMDQSPRYQNTGKQARDLDGDGIIDVIGEMGQSGGFSGLLSQFNGDQASSMMVYLQQALGNSSSHARGRNRQGIASVMDAFQSNASGMDLDLDDVAQFAGNLMNLFKH